MSEDAAPGPAGGPEGADPAAAETGTPARPRRSWRRRLIGLSLRRGLLALLAVFVILYLLVPQVAGARNDLQLLGRVNVGYLVAGVALEVGALLAYAMLTKAVLPRPGPSFFTLFRINLSTLAVTHVVPAGTAGGAGLGYRLLTDNGVRGADAAFGLATQGMGSALVLNLLLWLALLISIPLRGFNRLYLVAAVVGVVLLAAFGALVGMLTLGEEHAARALQAVAHRLPFVDETKVVAGVRRLAERLREVGRDRALLRRAVAWAAANWLLDAASLWVFVAAFGKLTSPEALLVAFGLGNVLAVIPVTPGGLGIVEGVITPLLVGFGTPRGIAILGVLSWRLVNFWLPIPAGAAAYLSMRLPSGGSPEARRRRRVQELAELAESTRQS
ncbi:MAG: flippase-like domain-containing protein [Acidimicrobiales bacterium]|nr:flippase-like domain-containing protein [Acidimicrobiales bacterium]MBO0887290.1 flippase-like domain-containing protein [Acidimicrobiales bacterium]